MSHLTSRLLVETLVFQDGKCQITVTHLLAFSFTLRWKHLHSGAANINRWPWKEKKKKPLSLLTLTDRSACLLIAENTEAWLTNSQHNVLYSVWATTYCIMCSPMFSALTVSITSLTPWRRHLFLSPTNTNEHIEQYLPNQWCPGCWPPVATSQPVNIIVSLEMTSTVMVTEVLAFPHSFK